MRLTIGELLHGKGLATIFSSKGSPKARGGEIRIDRNSVELHKTRLQTRRCSLENCGMSAQAVEELHCVVPRCVQAVERIRRLGLCDCLPRSVPPRGYGGNLGPNCQSTQQQ